MGYAFSTVLADLVHHNRWGGDLCKVDGRECSDPEVAEGVAKVVCKADGEPVGPAPFKPVELSGR